MAVQDLIITGHGRHAKVQVADVNLGNGTEATAVPGVLNVEGLDAHPRQAARMSAGVVSNGSVARSRQLDTKANYAARAGNAVIGTLAPGTNFDKRTSVGHEGSVGMLVADANRESIMRNVYAGTRLPVVGFSNDGSLRTKQLDMDEDGKVTIREVDSLMASSSTPRTKPSPDSDSRRCSPSSFIATMTVNWNTDGSASPRMCDTGTSSAEMVAPHAHSGIPTETATSIPGLRPPSASWTSPSTAGRSLTTIW